MSLIQTLVDTLNTYQAMPHHQDAALADLLTKVQTWQKQRIKRTNHQLFNQQSTSALAHYLIDRIYGNDGFDILANQLLTAGNNALNGSDRLEKLIPTSTLNAGVLGVQSAVNAIELDLALAQTIITTPKLLASFHKNHINDTLMIQAYQATHAKAARIQQIYHIKEVCEQSYKQFNTFLIQKTFPLAKSTAYEHGYQPLYDFIGEGLVAIKAIKKITDFTEPFVANELNMIDAIHDKGMIYD